MPSPSDLHRSKTNPESLHSRNIEAILGPADCMELKAETGTLTAFRVTYVNDSHGTQTSVRYVLVHTRFDPPVVGIVTTPRDQMSCEFIAPTNLADRLAASGGPSQLVSHKDVHAAARIHEFLVSFPGDSTAVRTDISFGDIGQSRAENLAFALGNAGVTESELANSNASEVIRRTPRYVPSHPGGALNFKLVRAHYMAGVARWSHSKSTLPASAEEAEFTCQPFERYALRIWSHLLLKVAARTVRVVTDLEPEVCDVLSGSERMQAALRLTALSREYLSDRKVRIVVSEQCLELAPSNAEFGVALVVDTLRAGRFTQCAMGLVKFLRGTGTEQELTQMARALATQFGNRRQEDELSAGFATFVLPRTREQIAKESDQQDTARIRLERFSILLIRNFDSNWSRSIVTGLLGAPFISPADEHERVFELSEFYSRTYPRRSQALIREHFSRNYSDPTPEDKARFGYVWLSSKGRLDEFEAFAGPIEPVETWEWHYLQALHQRALGIRGGMQTTLERALASGIKEPRISLQLVSIHLKRDRIQAAKAVAESVLSYDLTHGANLLGLISRFEGRL